MAVNDGQFCRRYEEIYSDRYAIVENTIDRACEPWRSYKGTNTMRKLTSSQNQEKFFEIHAKKKMYAISNLLYAGEC